MASRATWYWKSMLSRHTMNRRFSTTAPKMKTFAEPKPIKGEYVPVYMTMGLVVVVIAFATITLKLHGVHSPTVSVTKKKRGMMSEVEIPDEIIKDGEKFLATSFFRKVAHINDEKEVISNPISPRQADHLKSVGVNTKNN